MKNNLFHPRCTELALPFPDLSVKQAVRAGAEGKGGGAEPPRGPHPPIQLQGLP